MIGLGPTSLSCGIVVAEVSSRVAPKALAAGREILSEGGLAALLQDGALQAFDTAGGLRSSAFFVDPVFDPKRSKRVQIGERACNLENARGRARKGNAT